MLAAQYVRIWPGEIYFSWYFTACRCQCAVCLTQSLATVFKSYFRVSVTPPPPLCKFTQGRGWGNRNMKTIIKTVHGKRLCILSKQIGKPRPGGKLLGETWASSPRDFARCFGLSFKLNCLFHENKLWYEICKKSRKVQYMVEPLYAVFQVSGCIYGKYP